MGGAAHSSRGDGVWVDTMRTEIRKLDDSMQMLVYDNYNNFINATDTIRNMKGKMETFEPKIQGLDTKMESIRAVSAQVDAQSARCWCAVGAECQGAGKRRPLGTSG